MTKCHTPTQCYNFTLVYTCKSTRANSVNGNTTEERKEGTWVFGGIEENSRKCFMVPVEKRDRTTLIPIIEKWIEKGSVIISDYWKAYDILEDIDYTHLKVNHSIEFK